MKKEKIQIGVGTFAASARSEEYVLQALRSGRLSYGPWSRKFEKAFAALHDSSYAVFVNSGTSALSIAVACLKETEWWKDGDEVIVPALTFVATANVVLEHGLKPVFVDVDPVTYNINPALIEAAITPRTRAIIPVHLFGLIADMDPIMEIAKKHGLKIIEDSCETLGVTYKGRKAGSFGDISCFSTYVAHLIVTGVGGLAVTKSKQYAEILRSLANHGRDSIYLNIDDDRDIDGAGFQEVIRRRFRFVRRGYSFRATELEAALGVAQLEDLTQTLRKRQENAAFLTKELQKYVQWLQLPSFDSGIQEHAFMMYPIVIRPPADFPRAVGQVSKNAFFTKEDLVFHLEKRGVETRDMLPLINQPVYSSLNIRPQDFPVADWVNTHGFYIGCHQGLGERELKYVGEVFDEFLRRFQR